MEPYRRTWLPLAVLAVLLLFGTYVRVGGLGRGDFGVDELYQVFAAESLARGEGPRLPSGEEYSRGLDVTHLVRLTLEQFGRNELAARLPSTFFGVLGLFLFAAVLWRIAGAWVAVAGTALLAVYPEAVEQSRSLRFYTYQLSLGICALYTGWRALEPAGRAVAPLPGERIRQWGWAMLTVVILLLAARVQVVTLSVAAGWGAAALVAGFADLQRRGRRACRDSVPLQLVAAGAVLFALTVLLFGDEVAHMLRRARSVPFWVVTQGGSHTLAYYYSLVATYPLLVGLAPLIFLAAIVRRVRFGTFVTLWFAVPMLLHTLVLTWKGARFVMVPMLGLFVAAGLAAVWGAELLYRAVEARVRRSAGLSRYASATAVGTVGVVAITAFLTLPAFSQVRKLPRHAGSSQWTASAAVLQAHPELRSLPFGHTRPLHPLYYWGRIDFLVSRARLVDSVERTEEGEWRIEWQPVGSPDRSSGVPVITRPDDIRARFAEAGAVLIGADADLLRGDALEPDLVRVLTGEAEELCQGRCGRMRLFLWRFEPGAAAAALPAWLARPGEQAGAGPATSQSMRPAPNRR